MLKRSINLNRKMSRSKNVSRRLNNRKDNKLNKANTPKMNYSPIYSKVSCSESRWPMILILSRLRWSKETKSLSLLRKQPNERNKSFASVCNRTALVNSRAWFSRVKPWWDKSKRPMLSTRNKSWNMNVYSNDLWAIQSRLTKQEPNSRPSSKLLSVKEKVSSKITNKRS